MDISETDVVVRMSDGEVYVHADGADEPVNIGNANDLWLDKTSSTYTLGATFGEGDDADVGETHFAIPR